MNGDWDYVIVGAGAAGALLADRLTASGRARVLLLEAGPSGRSLALGLPVGWISVAYGKAFNWGFRTTPEGEAHNRRVRWPRGRVLGGSTAINGMIYVRGQPKDFDEWANAGADGWDWQSVAPFFERFENHSGDRLLKSTALLYRLRHSARSGRGAEIFGRLLSQTSDCFE